MNTFRPFWAQKGFIMKSRQFRSGFTLIELLVVIAVIALLIGLLLPALGKARKSGRQVVSLSNMRSIAQAGSTYQTDQKGAMPLTPTWTARMGPPNPDDPFGGNPTWCTWSSWGRTTCPYWITHYAGTIDIKAEDRPLNRYIYPDLVAAPNSRAGIPAQSTSSERTNLAMPIFKDPSDQLGHQQNWPGVNNASDNNGQVLSCYADVGTSYQWQVKWYDQISLDPATAGLSLAEKFALGARRYRVADSYVPSRLIWLNDEWADITLYQGGNARVKNGYDDINKAVVGFMDSHASYLNIITGGSAPADGRWDQVEAFCNDKYTVIFPYAK